MKTEGASVVLALAFFCFFSDVASQASIKDECTQIWSLLRSGKFSCPTTKEHTSSSDGKADLNKCLMCQRLLEKDSKNKGSGGEVNRNVDSLGEVRQTIATEASFIGMLGAGQCGGIVSSSDPLAECISLSEVGNAGLANGEGPSYVPVMGAGQIYSVFERRSKGARGFVPSTSIKETKTPRGSLQAIWSLLGNY